jgi:hypothetical protein
MRFMLTAVVVTFCLPSALAQPSEPVARLRHARSLRCAFTDSAVTAFRDGRRSVEVTHDKGGMVYDDISIERGTARAIGNAGASDLQAMWRANALWFIERAPAGNVIVTTVFPVYEAGTDRFIVIESRHWTGIALGTGGAEQASGSCTALD